MNSQEKLPIREVIAINIRAFKLIINRNPKRYVAKALHCVTTAVTPYIAIYITALLINEIAGHSDPARLRFLAIMALVSAAVLALINAALKHWRAYEKEGSWQDFRAVALEKLQTMNYASADSEEVRDKLATYTQSANWNNWGLAKLEETFEGFIRGIIGVIGAMALTVSLFTLSVPMDAGAIVILNNPLFMVGVITLMLFITVIAPMFRVRGESYFARMSDEARLGNRYFSAFGGHGYYNINAAMDLRMYRQDVITTHCNRSSQGAWGRGGSFDKYSRGPVGALFAASAAVGHVFTGVIYVYVCLKAWGGAFGVGSVTQYIGAVSALSSNMSSLIATVGTSRNNAVFLKLLFDFLDTPDDMYQGSLTTEKRSDNKYEIAFCNVSFKYPGSNEYAIKDLSLTFNIGQRLAVVGQNGSGKTTFIKLLCRLYDPTEGEILLNGIDIRKYDYQQYMNIFSAVFQDFQLLSFTLGQNVAASNDFDEGKVLDCLTRAGFGERLAAMPKGLATHLYKDLDKEGVEVSGGEAQKIAMARALYRQAPFIVLDEPTAALDPVAEFEIYSKMNEIVGDKTTVFISHRLSSCRFCQDIAVFHEGRLVERGNHDNLLANEAGKYHEMWHAQAQYYA